MIHPKRKSPKGKREIFNYSGKSETITLLAINEVQVLTPTEVLKLQLQLGFQQFLLKYSVFRRLPFVSFPLLYEGRIFDGIFQEDLKSLDSNTG
jgi:hypothetical protein